MDTYNKNDAAGDFDNHLYFGVMAPFDGKTCCAYMGADSSVSIYPRVDKDGAPIVGGGFDVWLQYHNSDRKLAILCSATEAWSATALIDDAHTCGDEKHIT